MPSPKFESSLDPVSKHLKVLLWGDAGTRKTETPLRYFPRCAVIDAEGATDLCRAMPEIPAFLALKTGDMYEVIAAVEAIVAGQVKLPDGSPVETIVIDSMSVLWHVRQEAGLVSAEARAARRFKGGQVDLDKVDLTFSDWGRAKRPIRQLMNRLNSIPFHVVVTARQKDEYAKRPGSNSDLDLVKVGATFDAEKNLDYEVDLAFHMETSREGKWTATVSKVRGRLGRAFPAGRAFAQWPAAELFAALGALTGPESKAPDIEKALVASSGAAPTLSGLVDYAASLGLSREAMREALTAGGFAGYSPEKHEAMKACLVKGANGKGSPAPEKH